MAIPLAAALPIGGAVLGGLGGLFGSSSQNRAIRRAATVQTAQVRDVATFERQQREREAAQIRARMRVIAADSGAMGSLRTTSATPVMESLLGAATSLFPAIPEPEAVEPRNLPAGAFGGRADALNRVPASPAQPPIASLDRHMPWSEVAEGPGSWQALERAFTMDLISALFMTDRNLWHQERTIAAGAQASMQNPLMAGIGGAMAGAQAGMGFANLLRTI